MLCRIMDSSIMTRRVNICSYHEGLEYSNWISGTGTTSSKIDKYVALGAHASPEF